MSRTRRALQGMATGYILMVVNIVFTMASVPLALKYLTTAQFGLWALVGQFAGYMLLIDLGMSVAVARILGDYKDQRDDGAYGSVLKTGALVFSIQAIGVVVCGTLAAYFMDGLIGIPASLKNDFRLLMIGQSVVMALGLAVRPVGAPLWCHNRTDVINLTNIGTFVISFATQWFGFAAGWGFYSLLLANFAGLFFSTLVTFPICLKLGLYPKAGCWGYLSRSRFRELFGFAGNFFLLQLGNQMMGASQVIIISRMISLEAAASWAVGTKIFVLAQQAVGKIFEVSAPTFAEMFVRKERDQLRMRFKQVVEITGALAVFVAVAGASLNTPFVAIWTHGKVAWSPVNDALMAILTILVAITRCHTGFVGISKEIRGMRFVYLAEGFLFVGLSLFLAPKWGIPGVLISAIVANVLCSGLYGFYRTALEFKCNVSVPAFQWNVKLGLMMLVGIFTVVTSVYFVKNLAWTIRGILPMAVLVGTADLILFWVIGLNANLKKQILGKIDRRKPLST